MLEKARPVCSAHLQPLPRIHLLERFSQEITTAHCLVHGAPGYGKTTFLKQFAGSYGGPVYYLDLDDIGSDVNRLIDFLAQLGGPSANESSSRVFAPQGTVETGVAEPFLSELIGRLANERLSSTVLIIDNVDVFQRSQCIDSLLGTLVTRLTSGLRLVISTRDLPGFPWARLELSRSLFRIGPEDLRLTSQEIAELVHRADLNPKVDERLEDVTEGWPVGVHHGIRILQASTNSLVQDLPLLLADDLLFEQYFQEEILNRQKDEVQRFMLESSLLPFFSERDLDELLGSDRTPIDFRDFVNTGGLINPSHVHLSSYAYNPLLRGYLNKKMNLVLPRNTQESLALRAARICANYGLIDEARRHYVTAGAFQTAADLLEKVADDYLEAYMLEVVRNWTTEIPNDIRVNRPWILAYQGKSVRRLGRNQTGMQLLESAQELFERQGDRYGIAFTSYELALTLYVLGRFKDAINVSHRALEMVGDDPALRSRLFVPLCMAYGAIDDYKASMQAGQQSLEELEKIPTNPVRPLLESRTRQFLARTYARMGKSEPARRQAELSLELSDEYELGSYKRVWSLHALAWAMWVAGERRAAFAFLAQADECGESDNPQQRRELDLIRGNLYLEEGEPYKAERSLMSCGRYGVHLVAYARLLQGDMQAAQNDIEKALRITETGETPTAYAQTLLVAALIDSEAHMLQSAIQNVERAIDIFRSRQAWQYLASAWFRLGLLHHALERPEAFRQSLQKSLEIARTYKMQHLLWIDAKALMISIDQPGFRLADRDYLLRLLKHEAAQGSAHTASLLSPWNSEYAFEVLNVVPQDVRVTGKEAFLAECTDSDLRARLDRMLMTGHVELPDLVKLRSSYSLTWREIEIYLRYFHHGATGAMREARSEVAASLNITENTLKVHVSNIRRKMSGNNAR